MICENSTLYGVCLGQDVKDLVFITAAKEIADLEIGDEQVQQLDFFRRVKNIMSKAGNTVYPSWQTANWLEDPIKAENDTYMINMIALMEKIKGLTLEYAAIEKEYGIKLKPSIQLHRICEVEYVIDRD